MRNYKFRAWYKEGKEMFTPAMLSFPNGQDRIIVSGRGGSTDTDEAILMQYTGLKDKNRREIYEGDLLRGNAISVQEVVWFPGGFVIMPSYEKKSRVQIYNSLSENQMWGWIQDCEVIGNIYENPELLT